MAATLQEWLRWPSRSVVSVAIFRPNLRLSGWTPVGESAPDTYAIALTHHVLADVIAGGLYRRCVGVRENATPLTAQSSLAAVDAAAGSYWWDTATETLYVHTTTGSDPDAFTVVHAQVEFYVANQGVVLDLDAEDPDSGVYCHPWLTSGIPGITSEVTDFLFGQKRTSTTDITLTNAAFVWYRLLANDGDYYWKNTTVRFFVGGSYAGQALPWSEYLASDTMQIETVACDDVTATFRLKPLARRLNLEVPITPIFESEYAALGDGVRGRVKPLIYGRCTLAPLLTDTSVSSGRWTIADAAYQTLTAIHAVNAIDKTTGIRTGLSEGTDYAADLTACTVTVLNTSYGYTTHDLEVDVAGKPDGSGSYLRTFAGIVEDLLVSVAGVDPLDIDTEAFAAAAVAAPEELSVCLLSPRTLTSIISANELELPSLEGSVLGTVLQTAAGLWTCRIWTPGYDASSVVSLQDADFVLFRPEPKLETVYWATQVYFNQNKATGDWPVEETSDAEIQFLADAVDVNKRYTFLRSATDAQTLAQRIQLISGAQSLEIECEERGAKLAQALAGDKVLITRERAPSAAGQFVAKPFELLRVDRAPNLAIAFRVGDLRGVGTFIGQWKADTAPAWADATAAERAEQPGFWTDDDGRAESLDPASAGLSLYW